ncbi:MAG: hypothetical protein J2P23_03670 [Microlunatus sp.]|nr:hypothetical protein [Microlunatus sp.]
MQLDDVARELYDGAPEDFVELRRARAAEARSAGDRDLAKQITALRRPTRSAWIVNLLSFQAADELAALLDLGAALADAQQRLSGDDLRQLSRQRNAAISALVKRGGQLAEVRGHRPSEATLREVTDSLQAALSDGEVAEVVRHGRLTQPQSYGGFGPELAFAAAPAAHKEPEPAEPPAGDRGAAEHQRRLDELATAQQALDRVSSRLARIEDQVARAVETADHRTERLGDLRDQLERAEREAERATADRDRLITEQTQLQAEKQQAEDQVAEALSRLAED